MEKKKLKLVDLFAGTGAFSFVFNKFNIETVFINDIEPSSEEICKLNGHNNFILKDINNINILDIPNHDILCGGFPCQPFSIAGEKKGFEDERSNVFWKIIEILKYHKPKYILLENVKNLKSHDKGNTYEIIYNSLIEVGYNIKDYIFDTCKYSILPQHRERIYITGVLKEYKLPIITLTKKNNLNLTEFLEKADKSFYYDNKSKIFDKLKESVVKNITTNTVYQYRRSFVRENKSNVCPTLTANMGTGGHNVPIILDDGIRKLTPRECFNLQGFPTDYNLPNISKSKLYQLAGNAVSIPIIEEIIKQLLELN